jgi:hypothetical protein
VQDGKFEIQLVDLTIAKTVSEPTGNPFMTATACRAGSLSSPST